MTWRQPESRTPPARLGDKSIATREDKELETGEEPDTTSQIGRPMNCHKGGRQMNWRQAKSQTPPARLGNKSIATREDTWIGDRRRAGHHQPDWETNESLYWETKMNWRQPKSRTPLARLGDKCIATRGNKWIGDSRRPGHHQPSWIETGRKPDATSQTGRQMNCHKREANNLDIAKAGHHQPHGDRDAQRAEHHQPDWETNGLPQGETHELETAKAGHHQPDWETNESVYGETNKLETAERPDTTCQTGKQMSCHKGRQMNWRQPEPDTNSQIGRQMNCHKEKQINVEQSESRTTTSEPSRTPL